VAAINASGTARPDSLFRRTPESKDFSTLVSGIAAPVGRGGFETRPYMRPDSLK